VQAQTRTPLIKFMFFYYFYKTTYFMVHSKGDKSGLIA